MRVEKNTVEAFTIYEASRAPGLGMLDPINVVLRDMGGCGQVVVVSFGAAWSCWFGAIGLRTLREFLADTSEEYLAGRLVSQNVRRTTKREEAYVKDIARAVIATLNLSD